MIKVLYFARYKDALDRGEESLEFNDEIATVSSLQNHLCTRGQTWQSTVGDSRTLVAVNQEISQLEAPIKDGDEVAFFPPVTGG